jgi:hypothetical protein
MVIRALLRWLVRTLNGETWGSGRSAAETGVATRGRPSEEFPDVEDRGNAPPPPIIR